MLEYIVGYADQRVLLAEHITVLADDSQTIDIRINHKAYIRLAAAEQIADLGQVLRQGFGVMREVAVGCAVEADDVLDAYSLQQCRDRQAANGVHAVDGYGEVSLADSFDIHELEVQHVLHVVGEVVLVLDSAQITDLGEGEILALGYSKHLFALFVG